MATSAAQETKLGPLLLCENEEDEDELFLFAGQLANIVGLPMSLKAAIELGVLEVLAKAAGQLSAAEIVAQLPDVHNPEASVMLERILRLLATFSILTCKVVPTGNGGGAQKRLYGLARSAKYLVPDENGVCWGSAATIMCNDKVFLDAWGKLKDAVLEGGIPFNLAHGTSIFEYLGMDTRFNNIFNRTMSHGSTVIMDNIVQSYTGFENIKQLVDVGGGVGSTLKAIISKYPNIKGINFDLPHVIQHAISYPGVEHVSGDMFESVPRGDAIWIKLVLHNWSDDHCIKLLKNCYKALPNDGMVIIVDPIIPDEPETTSLARFNALSDVLMLSQVPGGKKRTKGEFQSLAIAAGFTSIKLACCVHGLWVMELHK
ncbi:hypothetical protein Ancab_040102 [Ancistrocladus abbreviatus]